MAARIYLDSLSTTRVDERVLAAMQPFFSEHFGHPASRGHAYGWSAEKAVETARAQVADLIGAEPAEIVFTSGGTEADNLAVKGVAQQLASKGRHIVTTAVENRPVLDSCAWLERSGFEVTRVPVNGDGRVDPSAVEAALREDTVLVSVQVANHEVGTLQPVGDVAALVAARGVLFHSDATHAAAWVPIDVQAQGIHLLSLSAHKLYGPKGVGALYVRRRRPRVRLAPQMHGGGHERGLRSGTLNVPGAVGMGAAAELCRTERERDADHAAALRDGFERTLTSEAEDVRVLGDRARRLPNVSNVAFAYVEGESLVTALTDVAVSTGSACTSATPEPSHVLQAMGLSNEIVSQSVRYSLGRFTTAEEMARAAARVLDVVERVRAMSPAYAISRKRSSP